MFRTLRVIAMLTAAIVMGAPAAYAGMQTGQVEHPRIVTPMYSGDRINVNTATVEQLAAIPAIGEKTAKAIVAYRDANGPFRNLDELQYVNGIFSMDLGTIGQYVLVN